MKAVNLDKQELQSAKALGDNPPSQGDAMRLDESFTYTRHPNHFIHGLLSAHAYYDSQDGDQVRFPANDHFSEHNNTYLKSWKVHKVLSDAEAGRYYGAIYVNDADKQIVLAHRGTTAELKDLLKQDSPLKTDFKGVFGTSIVAQQAAAFELTKEAVELADDKGYYLSCTGHSLGAWLAELSTYFSFYDFGYHKVKSVTFDSPGSVVNLDKLAPNVLNYATERNIMHLDLTTYLSAPNFINSCNKHVGKVYRLFPDISKAESVEKYQALFEKIPGMKANGFYLEGFLSVMGHRLTPLIDTFDPETGKPKHYEEVNSWPTLQYTPANITKNTLTGLIGSAIDLVLGGQLIPGFIKRFASSKIHEAILDNTLESILSVVVEFANGNIDVNQYFTTYEYLDSSKAPEGYPVKEELSNARENFRLLYEGKYHTQKINFKKDVLTSDNKGSPDWYLNQLTRWGHDNSLSGTIQSQLKHIKSQYEIVTQAGRKYIHVLSDDNNSTVEALREKIIAIVEQHSSVKKIFDSPKFLQHGSIAIASNLTMERMKDFVGREDVFADIDKIFETEQYLAISAFAGTGKSSAALEYGYQQIDKGKIVRCIEAASMDKISAACIELAKDLGCDVAGKPIGEVIQLVRGKLANQTHEMLFIFDNLEKYEEIKAYIASLPKNVKILITTRHEHLSENIPHLHLEPFSKEEAQEYLNHELKHRVAVNEVSALIEKVGLLPYKLGKVVAFLKANKFLAIKDYIEKHADNVESELFTSLVKDAPEGWEIMQYCAYLDPDFIGIDIIQKLTGFGSEKLQSLTDKLEALSLVTVQYKLGQSGLKLHRLVQEEALDYRKKHQDISIKDEDIRSKILDILNELFPMVTGVPGQDWKVAKAIQPHINEVLESKQSHISEYINISLYSKLMNYYDFIICDYKQALNFNLLILKIQEKYYFFDRQDIVSSLNNIGSYYDKLGETTKALEYGEKALEIQKKFYQVDNSATATFFDNIGGYYSKLGETTKALEYGNKALKMREALYQGSHPAIATSLNNIGGYYSRGGNIEKALEYAEKALNMFKTSPQDNSLYIAKLLNNIGGYYSKLGDTRKALEYGEKAIKMKEELYQGNHPDIATTLCTVGSDYYKFGDIRKALEYGEKALKMLQELYQGNHRDIAQSLSNIGLCYNSLGDIRKALEYGEEALRMLQELYQGNHPHIATCLNNIGGYYDSLGDSMKALEYEEKALKMLQELYQGNHPDIAQSLNNIGKYYSSLEDSKKALEYGEKALKMQEELYQGNHPSIATSLNNIGGYYDSLGDKAKSYELKKYAYTMYRDTLGNEHSQTQELHDFLKLNTISYFNPNEEFIPIRLRGDFNSNIFDVKEKIQVSVLNRIHEAASKGKWESGYFIFSPWKGNCGVKGFTEENYLKKCLGDLNTLDNLKIAQMLCFEAINLSIMNSEDKDFTCLKEFSRTYPKLVKEIALKHPEYFVDGLIVKECDMSNAIKERLLGSSIEKSSTVASPDYIDDPKDTHLNDPENNTKHLRNLNLNLQEDQVKQANIIRNQLSKIVVNVHKEGGLSQKSATVGEETNEFVAQSLNLLHASQDFTLNSDMKHRNIQLDKGVVYKQSQESVNISYQYNRIRTLDEIEEIIENENLETLKHLSNDEVNLRNEQMESLLHLAASYGSLEVAKILYEEKGLSFYDRSEGGYLPIHIAAGRGHIDLVKWFLSIDIHQIDQRSDFGYTPLHLAAKNSEIKVMEYLIEKNADYEILDNSYRSPIRLLLNEHPIYEKNFVDDSFAEPLMREKILEVLGDISSLN